MLWTGLGGAVLTMNSHATRNSPTTPNNMLALHVEQPRQFWQRLGTVTLSSSVSKNLGILEEESMLMDLPSRVLEWMLALSSIGASKMRLCCLARRSGWIPPSTYCDVLGGHVGLLGKLWDGVHEEGGVTALELDTHKWLYCLIFLESGNLRFKVIQKTWCFLANHTSVSTFVLVVNCSN